MRHRSLIPVNVRFLGATMRRLSFHFAAEGEGAGGEGAGAGGGTATAAVVKTYTEEDIAGLKQKNAELIAKQKTLSARAAVIGDRTPEEVQADLEFAAQAREDRAKAAGEFDTLKKQMADQSAKALAARDQTIAERDAEVHDLVGKQAVIEAISAAGGKVKKLTDPVMKNVKVVRGDDGRAVAIVVDTKGNQRIVDGQGTPMTIAQLVESFKADEDYMDDFKASGASGSGARNESGGGRGSGSTVLIPKNASPQEYRRMKDDAVKRGVPYAIAS
jgi:hypothetical protein